MRIEEILFFSLPIYFHLHFELNKLKLIWILTVVCYLIDFRLSWFAARLVGRSASVRDLIIDLNRFEKFFRVLSCESNDGWDSNEQRLTHFDNNDVDSPMEQTPTVNQLLSVVSMSIYGTALHHSTHLPLKCAKRRVTIHLIKIFTHFYIFIVSYKNYLKFN